jgi:hypothetical protein
MSPTPKAEDADEKAEQERLEAKRNEEHARHNESHRVGIDEVTEVAHSPFVHGKSQEHESGNDPNRSDRQDTL